MTDSTSPQTPERVVVVGGGLAGARTAETLRDAGYDGSITLFAAENHLPYDRPPLSKGFLQGETPREETVLHPQEWYDEKKIDLKLGTAVTAVEAHDKQVRATDGSSTPYDVLVLATGSSPRRLDLPGADLGGVVVLRTVDDAQALRDSFEEGRRLVVIGGGWIGLEVAASARQAGVEVTVLENAAQPLVGVVGEEIGAFFAALHRDHGVDVRTGVEVESIEAAEGSHKAGSVRLKDGTSVAADLVLLGVGATPNVDVARGAGLQIGESGGVLVDAQGRSSDASIFAVGDIAEAETPALGDGERVRTEHWATANDRPEATAAAIVGKDDAFDKLPFFYSDQYDLGLEYSGHGSKDDEVVVRGSLEKGEFVAFWLDKTGRVRAGMNVNVWDVQDDIQKVIASGKAVDKAELADEETEIGSLA
ncbi:NAD(P)/FAD-dependent oxidoreductase [Lapillicoccus jejuensis]|uniref:NAD/ferredoxin-dependent reductase-like protein n=1 Tax=Lapillicoccus jejuensis TaxID=402171 RepID=A0A542DZC4_9MICO|nr:FAD/NAD(P)-binding oxidoreductase [Lapillicoccus jejuensis]TQJ08284.1 NAD/ferredoxin-dependent reductase-like protein [Lapillicoccus jejuensis]